MRVKNIIEIVSELNDHLHKKNVCPEYAFAYITDGYHEYVTFADVYLWSSEEDNRIYDEENDEYESLKTTLMREYNKYIDKLNVYKFGKRDMKPKPPSPPKARKVRNLDQ